MTENRLELRKHFAKKKSQANSDDSFDFRTNQLSNLEDTIIVAINHLVSFMDGNTTKTEVINQLKSISTPDVDKVVTALEKLDKKVVANKLDLNPLQELLRAIGRELKSIPKELPEFKQKDSVKVTNLKEVKLDTSKIEKAIKDLKLDPKVKVDAPIVNVERPDLKPIQNLMLDLVTAFNKQKPVVIPEFPKIPETDLGKVEKKLDQANKYLKAIREQRFGGGGGGGGHGTPYTDPTTGNSVYVELDSLGSIPVNPVKFPNITGTTYDGSQNLTQIVYEDGTNTKTVDFTYDANNNISTKTAVIT